MFKKLLKSFLVLAGIGLVFGILIGIYVGYLYINLPELKSLADYNPPLPSKVFSKDGELLYEFAKENRVIADVNEIPPVVINAFLAAEDDNFYNHRGIDYMGILRAMYINIKAGRVVQGGSTITQQVAKSLLLSKERTISRKIKDLLLAKRIEQDLQKDEILYLYLNQVYLGGGYYGVKAAFRGYFEKNLEQATIAESALIAGLLVAPGRYSPYVNPQYAKKRQRYVLKRLFETKKISEIEYEEALKENIKMHIRKPQFFKAGYFTDWIRQEIVKRVGTEDLLINGYQIQTTLNWKLQQVAEKAVLEGVKAIDKRQGYKGPLANVSDEEFNNEILKVRQEIYKDKSEYFTFNSDGTTTSEYEMIMPKKKNEEEIDQDEENQEDKKEEKIAKNEEIKNNEKALEDMNELEIIEKARKEIAEEAGKVFQNLFLIGNPKEDPLPGILEPEKIYEVLVEKVSDNQKLIYVTLGGTRGLIAADDFRWAYDREISEKPMYHAPLTRPSKTFKKGDKILAKLNKTSTSLWYNLDKNFRARYKNDDFIKKVKAQNFLSFSLEQDPEVQGALLSINPKTGEIVCMVGGSQFQKSQFNRVVQSRRQPGSAFKPIIYAAGLESGFTPSTKLLDTPQALGGFDESLDWKPKNYDGKFKGRMTFRRALETSRNIPTIRLLQDIGVSKVIDFTKRIGMDAELPSDLSLSLGSFGINLMEMTQAFAIFPNAGKKVALKSILEIKNRDGEIITLEELADISKDEKDEIADTDVVTAIPNAEELKNEEVSENEESAENNQSKAELTFTKDLKDDYVYDKRLSYIMINLLKGVITNGTGRQAQSVGNFIGGKTGTTNDYIDAWFMGFSKDLATGVWTGFDNNESMGFGEAGSKAALPIWKDFMEVGVEHYGERDFAIPRGLVNVLINRETGKETDASDPGAFRETFVQGFGPDYQTFKIDTTIEPEEPLEEGEEAQPKANIIINNDDDYYSD